MKVCNLKDHTTFYASSELLEQLKGKMKEGDIVVNFAYTDYGGSFFDKVAIKFFTEKHPESIVSETTYHYGENAFIWGDLAKQFLEASENYPLGFEHIEDFYLQMECEEQDKAFTSFLDCLSDKYDVKDNAFEMLSDRFAGYWSVEPSGLDYSSETLLKYCIEKELITERIEN